MPPVVPQYIGPAQPQQVVQIRLGRFSRYLQDNPPPLNVSPGGAPNGAGHQPWTGPFEAARVGLPLGHGIGENPYYNWPWQAKWFPTTSYVTVPNVQEVRLDKKLEGLIGGIGTATVQIENILYTAQPGGYHTRERGAMSPLRGKHASGNAWAPSLPELLDELEQVVGPNEWEGRFVYAAQITIHQGYGTTLAKTFTGLIEDLDTTSRPDRITLTCRDFGQVFTETHFFGWGKDPVIDTPVIFIDKDEASSKENVGYEPSASSEDSPDHVVTKVTDHDPSTWWQSDIVHDDNATQFVDIRLPEGVYQFGNYQLKWGGMDVYLSLHPTNLTGGGAPTRTPAGSLAEDMTIGNNWLDASGWYDPTKEEKQITPGETYSYSRLVKGVSGASQTAPIEMVANVPVHFRVGNGTKLRLSFRHLHKVELGENFRAGVTGLEGLREATSADASKQQWVLTKDAADVIRILCMWAGFKEWDIPETGIKLPQRIVAYQDKSYMDVIKQVAETIGFTFFMADPEPDSAPRGEESLGVPTFRKARLLAADSDAEKKQREEGLEANGRISGVHALPNRGRTRPGLPNPLILDRQLLTAINLKQTNEPLAYVIRVWGTETTRAGDAANGVASGKKLWYTFRPPWTGDPPYYRNTRLGGILKQIVHHNKSYSTLALCREAALFLALHEAIEASEVTIEFPANPGLDLDDHAQIMDLGTGVTSRLAVLERSSIFTDGEKRKYAMTVTGPLLDTPDVRDMVDIINGVKPANGAGGEWSNATIGEGSSLGYG